MEYEIKTLEVSNSEKSSVISIQSTFGWKLKTSQRIYSKTATPDVFFNPYNNETRISIETETIDFTELVFERDRDMLNYREITELEDEYYHLELITEEKRPYMPSDTNTMEEWAKKTQPDLMKPNSKFKTNLLFILIGVVGCILTLLISASIGESEVVQIVGAIIMILIGFNCFFLLRVITIENMEHRALKIAMKPKPSYYRARLENMYNTLVKRIQEYDNNKKRMREIIFAAKSLID